MVGEWWLFSADTVLERKAKCCCHVIGAAAFAEAVLNGSPDGSHRGPGRPGTCMVTNILKWAGMDYNVLKDAALVCHHVPKNTQQLPSGYNLLALDP